MTKSDDTQIKAKDKTLPEKKDLSDNENGVRDKQKKPEEEILYASFNQRLLALGLDIVWIYYLVTPVAKIFIDSAFGALDSREGIILIQALAQQTGELAITYQEALQQFVASNYAKRWFIENIAQTIVMGVVIVPFWVYYGASPGMWLFGMQVKKETNGENPGWIQAIFRFIMCAVSFIPLTMGFVWIVFNKENKAWHDIAANTVVIRKKWQWQRWKR